MAEFLIYNKDHWMDALSAAQIKQYIKKYPNFQAKYDSRYQRGDVVEVREDGFYTSTLKGDLSKWAFRVVCVAGMSVEEAEAYHVTEEKVEFDLDEEGKIQYDIDNNLITKTMILKRCKFSILSGDGKYVETVTKVNLQVLDKATI